MSRDDIIYVRSKRQNALLRPNEQKQIITHTGTRTDIYNIYDCKCFTATFGIYLPLISEILYSYYHIT